MSLPLLRFHAKTKQFYVWISHLKKRLYLGSDPDRARMKYAEFLAGREEKRKPCVQSTTVSQATKLYLDYAKIRYPDPREYNRVKISLAKVNELFGTQPVSHFKAKALRDVRTRLLSSGKVARSRNYVNKLVRVIQGVWRWLGSEEMVPAECVMSIRGLTPLRNGEGGKERLPVEPPPPADVEATIAKCPALVARMLRFQLLTGVRPGEVCQLRWEEISIEPDKPVRLPGSSYRKVSAIRCGETVVWICAPSKHKTLKRGKTRAIAIGPKAQAIAGEPQESGIVFLTRQKTAYRVDSYCHAITRACAAASVDSWHPNQLRHARATDLAEQFDASTAAAVLGHAANSTATNIYVEQATRKAANAAAQTG